MEPLKHEYKKIEKIHKEICRMLNNTSVNNLSTGELFEIKKLTDKYMDISYEANKEIVRHISALDVFHDDITGYYFDLINMTNTCIMMLIHEINLTLKIKYNF
jgi:hypothetical protein